MILRLFAATYNRLHQAYWRRTYQLYREAHQLDDEFSFNGDRIVIFGAGTVVAGAGSYLSRGCFLHVGAETQIVLGRDVHVAQNVRIDSVSSVARHDRRTGQKVKSGTVRLHDFVWVGCGAYIGPGVTIGENSVVGANAVVTRDVPPDCIVQPATMLTRSQ